MKHKIPLHIVSIEGEGFHIFVDGFINDLSIKLLIDTGASRSVFDKKKLLEKMGEGLIELTENEKLSTGLGTNTMKSESLILDNFRIGDLEIKGYQAVILEMSHVNVSYEQIGLPPIDGVLGGDILKKHKAVINYRKKVLSLKSKDQGR